MSAQHTPGPWEAYSPATTAARHAMYVAGGERVLAGIMGGATLGHLQEAHRNAALMAAAPDLLAALQRAKNSLVAFKFMPGPANAWEDSDEANLQAVNDALAKATGGAL